MASGLAASVKAAPLQALGIRMFVLHSQIFEDGDDDDCDLRYLDFPSLIDGIGDSLDNLHILQTFTEARLR